MPAFRWLDKATGTIIVSNHPKFAAQIERDHSDGNGLLAHNGSSYGNLFSGDAERSVLTMSGAGRRKEGRTGAGYFGYFSRPGQAIRTLVASCAEITRERVAAARQRRRGVEPRVERDWTYALLRTFTTVVTRDGIISSGATHPDPVNANWDGSPAGTMLALIAASPADGAAGL